MDWRGTSGEITMITYTVRDETTTQRRMLSGAYLTMPCFRVYREDGTCMATYDNAGDAHANAQERMTEDADITWAEIEAEGASR